MLRTFQQPGRPTGLSRTVLWAALLSMAGCGPVGPEPRLISERIVGAEPVSLKVCSYGDAPGYDPEILGLRAFADGERIVLPVRVVRNDDPACPGQTASFFPPPHAAQLRVELWVAMAGRQYLVTVPFERLADPKGPWLWRRGDETVRDLGPLPDR